MNPARVVVAGFYPPPFAGEPIHVKQLGEFLRQRGFRVDILNLNRHAPPSHEYLNAPGRLGTLRRLIGLQDRSSILHLHTNGHNWKSWLMITTAALAAQLKGTRAILTIHSGLFPGYVIGFGGLRRALARWVLHRFARVIGVNREIGGAMTRLGVREGHAVVIPAFLGVGRAAALEASDRALIGDRRPLLVAVGGGDRDPELGLPVVIDALPELIRQFPGLCAVFLGWQVGPKVRPLIESRGLAQHAVCVGEISHERCLGFLQEANVVVRSTFADGDAITVREALGLGVPVVASDTAFRPPGVILFRKGDRQELLARLGETLAAPTSAPEQRDDDPQAPARELGRVYSQIAGPAAMGKGARTAS
jgi:glycosyltransferase involved in cell wall biosynthesis